MSRNRWSKIAKEARDKFDIPHTTALQCCRDLYADPAFEVRMETLRKAGLTFTDSMLRMIDEEWDFYDEPVG